MCIDVTFWTIEVTREEWEDKGFTEKTAIKVQGVSGSYDFFVNVDNESLEEAIGKVKDPAKKKVLKDSYKFGMFVIAWGILSQNEEDDGIKEKVEEIKEKLSPFFLPMIELLNDMQGRMKE